MPCPYKIGDGDMRARHAAPLRILILYIAANLLTLALYLPWLPTAVQQLTHWPNTGQPVMLAQALQTLLGWFTFGLSYPALDASWIAVALILLLLGLRREGQALWRMLLPAVWVILPVGLFLALGMFREDEPQAAAALADRLRAVAGTRLLGAVADSAAQAAAC